MVFTNERICFEFNPTANSSIRMDMLLYLISIYWLL